MAIITYYSMIVVAAKPSSDPKQEKLRQNKREWQKKVRLFIDDLINLKRLMGGQPSKFLKEKSNIKNPIPADPITIINSLAHSFNEITQQGNAIVQQQLDYSKTRKKKQTQQPLTQSTMGSPVQTQSQPPANDLTQQLTASIDEYQLMVLASNPFSRFFARLLNPAIGGSPKARIRKYRMSLLKSSIEIYRDLENLQAAIVSSSPESIFESSRIFSKISGNWEFLKTGLNTYAESKEKTTTEKPKSTGNNIPVDTIIDDYRLFADKLSIKRDKLVSAIVKYKKIMKKQPIDFEEVAKLSEIIEEEYNKILFSLNAKYGIEGSSLKEIWHKAKTMDEKLVKPSKQELIPSTTPLPKGDAPPAAPVISQTALDIPQILEDYLKYSGNFTDMNMKKLSGALVKWRLGSAAEKQVLANEIKSEYSKILAILNAKHKTTGTTLKSIFEEAAKKQASSSMMLESLGQRLLERWLGKIKHQFSPFDKTSAHRLDVYKHVESIKTIIDQMMDSLEKEMNVDFLITGANQVSELLDSVSLLIQGLEGTLRGGGFDKSFIDLLHSGKITNLSPGLSPEQRKHLERLIENRRLRDLTQMYRGRGKI